MKEIKHNLAVGTPVSWGPVVYRTDDRGATRAMRASTGIVEAIGLSRATVAGDDGARHDVIASKLHRMDPEVRDALIARGLIKSVSP